MFKFLKRAVAAGSIAGLLVAGLAIAGGTTKAKVVAEDFTIPDIYGDGFATCEGGKRVVGGGAVELDQDSPPFMSNSGPLDESGTTAQTADGDVAKIWYAAGERSAAPGEQGYRVIALCSGTSDAEIEATTFTPDTAFARRGVVRRVDSRYGVASAECEGKARAIGGGVVVSGSANGLEVLASGPLDASGKASKTNDGDTPKMWYAAIKGNAPVPTQKVFALCSADSKATIEATKTDVDPQEFPHKNVKCGGDRHVTGGGMVQIGSFPGQYLRASGPLDDSGEAETTQDGDRPTQWHTVVQNYTASDTIDVKLLAVCE
jgi:hypothetical protein